jgi:hypothetical protein
MSKRTGLVVAAGAVAALLAAAPARAIDPWEAPPFPDDNSATLNTLGHGGEQIHDLDQGGTATNDIDWVTVPTLARHSYEVRLSNASVQFDWGACTDCAQFERVSAAGAILTDDVSTVNEGGLESYDRSVRWIATANTTNEYVRITGNQDVSETSSSVYTLRYWDTTYSIPRWNHTGTQTTVVLVTNLTQNPVSVVVHFYSATGGLLATASYSLLPNALNVLSTGLIPALAGQSGHIHIAHTAGYGGLSGKAVALEPSTGFTFDTAMTPIPQ